jgi:hypothetical protein
MTSCRPRPPSGITFESHVNIAYLSQLNASANTVATASAA